MSAGRRHRQKPLTAAQLRTENGERKLGRRELSGCARARPCQSCGARPLEGFEPRLDGTQSIAQSVEIVLEGGALRQLRDTRQAVVECLLDSGEARFTDGFR